VNTKTYKLLIKTKSSINRIVKMQISQWEGEFKIEEKEICFRIFLNFGHPDC
jgi:hypothetical protein